MKDIGSQLREAREKRKLSIQDVAIATKINNKVIKAIEDGDTENLPAKPFLRGFVQSYARYLELNVDDVMKKFLELQGSTKPKPQIIEDNKQSQISHEEVQNKFELYKKAAYVGAALIAVLFIYFIQKTVSRYEQESKVAKEQQEAVKSQVVAPTETPVSSTETTAETLTTDVATPAPAPAPAPTAEVKVEVKPEEKKPEVKVVEVKTEEEKKPEVKVQAQPLITAPAVEKPKVTPVVAAPAPAVISTPKPTEVKPTEVKAEVKPAPKVETKPSGKPQQVIIEALDNVEIKYVKDGEPERTVKLKPEQFLTIRASSKVSLNVSDSGAVNIIHNGRDNGVPGNLGQPTKINYP